LLPGGHEVGGASQQGALREMGQGIGESDDAARQRLRRAGFRRLAEDFGDAAAAAEAAAARASAARPIEHDAAVEPVHVFRPSAPVPRR